VPPGPLEVLQGRFIGVRKGEVQRPWFDASSFAHHGTMGAADAHLALIAQNPYPFSFMLRSIDVRITRHSYKARIGRLARSPRWGTPVRRPPCR